MRKGRGILAGEGAGRVPEELELGDADREVKQGDTAELRPGSNSIGGMREQQGCSGCPT